MSITAFVTGTIFKAPVEKTSKTNKPYLIVTLKGRDGDADRFITCFVFNEAACDEIRALQVGGPLALSGAIDATIYQPEGKEPRVSWTLTADGVLTAQASEGCVRPRDSRTVIGGSRHGRRQ